MLPTRSVELRSSIWKRLCLHSYGSNSYITQRNTSLPPTHTHTHVYIHTQQPPSNPVRFPANSKVGSRLEHFSALATSLCLPFRPFSTFVPLLASLFSIYRFLFTSKTTAKGTFLSVIQKTMVKSENCTWSRMRKCSHDGKKVRIPLEETAEAWNMHLPRSSRHVSILNIYI